MCGVLTIDTPATIVLIGQAAKVNENVTSSTVWGGRMIERSEEGKRGDPPSLRYGAARGGNGATGRRDKC